MKTVLSIFSLVVLLSTSVYSQIDASLKAGVDMNTIEYNIETESIKYNSLLAGHFGINLDVALGNTSYIRSGLIYNLKGEKNRNFNF